jgi:hypothetical protein
MATVFLTRHILIQVALVVRVLLRSVSEITCGSVVRRDCRLPMPRQSSAMR